MIPLEKLKSRIVGIVTREFEHGDTKHPTTFKPDAYVFSTPDDTYYCCGAYLTRSQVDQFISEGKIQSCFAVKPEFVDASIFHDYTVMYLYPYTFIEYWKERGILQEEIDKAIDVFMMTMNMVVGTYELSIRDFNVFLFGMFMGKTPSIFDGVKA